MNKNLATIGVVAILICVGLSGCNESTKEEETLFLSINTVIEAIAHVAKNSTGESVTNASVTFEFGVNGKILSTLIRTTDSTGWTSFAVANVLIPEEGEAFCKIYLTNGGSPVDFYKLDYYYAKKRLVNDGYYWSLSARLVQN